MEPGGIEPPCRNRPIAASTRVFDDLISVGHPASTPSAPPQPPAFSHLRASRRHTETSPMSSSRALSGVEPGMREPKLGRESELRVGSCEFARLLTRPTCAATRHDDLYLSGRNQFGPSFQRCAGREDPPRDGQL
jgi:hypothetical protein